MCITPLYGRRLAALVAANPWLCGRLVREPGAPLENCVKLWVPKAPDYTSLVAQMDSATLVPGQVRHGARDQHRE